MKKIILLLLLVLLIPIAACTKDQPVKPKEFTTNDVIEKLKKEGLAINKVVKYNEKTDTNELLGRPGQYNAKSNFGVKELEEDDDPDMDISEGGSVEIFKNKKDAKTRLDYLDQVTTASPMLAEYHYLNNKMILRLSNKIIPSKAKTYEKAFKSMK